MTEPAKDYSINPRRLSYLMGAVFLPHDIRLKLLKVMQQECGQDEVLELFAQFIGLANSVVSNCHEALEQFLIVKKDWHPYQAEKVNFPTVWGALNGVKLSKGVDQSKTCHGCACRLGSLANQSPATTVDVDWCLVGEDRFMCHEELDESGNPTKRCVGFEMHRKKACHAAPLADQQEPPHAE